MSTLDEYKAVINNSIFSDSRKSEIIDKLDYTLQANMESLKKSYDSFKERSKNAGIDWSNATLSYIDFKHTSRNNVESADIYLYINFQGGTNKISLNDCMRAGGTWLMGNEISFKGMK